MNDKQLRFIAHVIAVISGAYDKDRVEAFIVHTYKELEEDD